MGEGFSSALFCDSRLGRGIETVRPFLDWRRGIECQVVDVIDKLKNTLKQYRITCVLIRDEKFEQLFTLLYGEMLDSYRTLDITPLQKNKSENTFIISNPETDSTRIDEIYRTYETLSSKIDSNASSSRKLLFKEFIKENYMHICNKFHCSSIKIYIESLKDRVEILAAPMVEDIREPQI